MVLEEALLSSSSSSSSNDGLMTDGSPSNDSDTYASSRTRQVVTINGAQVDVSHVDFDNLPRPFLGWVQGMTASVLVARVSVTLAGFQSNAHRDLSTEEKNAIAQHVAGSMRVCSYVGVASLGAGLYRWWTTRAIFKFPFLNNKWTATGPPDTFAFVRGPAAKTAWQLVRAMPYAALGIFCGQMASSIIMPASLGMRLARDSRLKQFQEDLIRQAQEAQLQRRAQFDQRRQHRQQQPQQPQQQQQLPQRSYDSYPAPQTQQMPGDYNDASPQVDAGFNGSGDQTNTQMRGMTESSSASAERYPQEFSPPKPQQPTPQPPRQTYDGDRFQSGSEQSDSQGGMSTESTWARIRRRAVEKTQDSTPTDGGDIWAERRDSSGGKAGEKSFGDSFSFSSTEEERQLAKAEAQQDFDSRIDQERQGKDFNGGQRRWK